MELNNYKRKFKDLFDKFFKDNFELSRYYSEGLIKYFRDNPDKCEKIVETPFFSDLMIYALSNIEATTYSVKCFIIGLLATLLSNELQCSKFVHVGAMELMFKKLFRKELNPNLRPAMIAPSINLQTAIVSHSTGIIWAIQNRQWTILLTSETHKKPPIISQACYNFISKLVWKLDEYDEEPALIEVLNYIVHPIRNNEYQNIQVMDDEAEMQLYEPILSSLNCLLVIVSEANNIVRANKVIVILQKHLFIEPSLSLLLDVTRNQNFVILISQLFFRIGCSMPLHNRSDLDVPQEITILYYNVLNRIVYKRLVLAAIHFSADCVSFWSKIDRNTIPSTFERYERTFDVQDQFLIPMLMPLLKYSHKACRQNQNMIALIEAYHYKLKDLSTEHIVKVAYSVIDLAEHSNVKNTAIESLQQFLRIKNYLTGKQAGFVYQALFYTLHCYIASDEEDSVIVGENPISCPKDIKFLSLVLNFIYVLLKEHNINWYENVEIISLQNCLMNLLKQNLLPGKQLLQAVDLIDLSIRKLLSPDLALLMESRRGSTLNEIVTVTKVFMQHQDWEIRDSALHLLLSCTELAYLKYIPLQKLLYENDLIVLAAHTALNDDEMYVQMTALRCLATATKIETIWRHALIAHPNLCGQLVYILKNHSEGIVRKEAANVLLELYIHQKITPQFTEYLFNVMTSAAIEDLHWEVQMIALQFWKVTIQYHVSNRGMIDGKFPTVTFCKVKRKIIVLNETVIENQLTAIMNDLSLTGCLKVLHKCLNEEYNIQVMEQAYSVANELMTILHCYKYDKVPENSITPPNEDIRPKNTIELLEMSVDLTNQTEFIRNQVIESIVHTNQSELIQHLYDKPVESKSEEAVNVNKWMDPNEFLRSYRNTDHKALIEDKKNWNSGIRSLDALLDEILILGEEKHYAVEECS